MALDPRRRSTTAPGDSPGVYRVPHEPAAEGGLAVGVPAFLGAAWSGRLSGRPRAFRRYAQFREAFGTRHRAPGLADAVGGFFDNGGALCYVVALPDLDDPDEALDVGLQAIAEVDDVDLVAAPDLAFVHGSRGVADPPELRPADDLARLQQGLIADCDRHGGRIALLDAPRDADVEALLRHRAKLTGTNAALYAPWLSVAGPDGGPAHVVPPCGHVAGAIAATDRAVGVFKAPANVALNGVLDVVQSITAADQDRLNPAGINALRAFPGRGVRVWGARTLSSDPNWRFVNVRRLFLTVGRWIERNLMAVAFEPHDARLWSRISREVTGYVQALFAAGALKGTAPDDAFFVKCDAETNPPEVREAGTVVVEIGLAPAVPQEFVVVRITVATQGVAIAALG